MKTYTVIVKDQDDDLMQTFIVEAEGPTTLLRKMHKLYGKYLLDQEIALDRYDQNMILESVNYDFHEGEPVRLK